MIHDCFLITEHGKQRNVTHEHVLVSLLTFFISKSFISFNIVYLKKFHKLDNFWQHRGNQIIDCFRNSVQSKS